jgi:hypothetical protein
MIAQKRNGRGILDTKPGHFYMDLDAKLTGSRFGYLAAISG